MVLVRKSGVAEVQLSAPVPARHCFPNGAAIEHKSANLQRRRNTTLRLFAGIAIRSGGLNPC